MKHMQFFERLLRASGPPAPEPPEPPRPAWLKPETALPGVVATELLLARSSAAAIAVSGLLAYPTGFEFILNLVLRREDRRGRILGGPGWLHGPAPYGDEPLPDEFVRLGVAFADGRVASNLGRRAFPAPDSEPTGPVLLPDGGGGGGRHYDMRYWVWPLPPPGPVAFVCEWPALGIPESRAEIDAGLILDAATRAVQLWPEDSPSR